MYVKRKYETAGGRIIAIHEMGVDDLATTFQRGPHELNASANPAQFADGKKWSGGLKSIDEAVSLVRDGWKKGADRVAAFAEKIADQIPEAVDVRRRPTFSDDGDDLLIDRALAGQWDSAYRVAKRTRSVGVPFVEIDMNWGMNGSASASEMFWPGACAVALTAALEKAGYSVKLTVSCLTQYGRHFGINRVWLKDGDSPCLIDAVAGLTCHAGVFRTIGFMEVVALPIPMGGGYGSQGDWREFETELRGVGEWNEDTIKINIPTHEYAAIAEVTEAIKRIQNRGIEAEAA